MSVDMIVMLVDDQESTYVSPDGSSEWPDQVPEGCCFIHLRDEHMKALGGTEWRNAFHDLLKGNKLLSTGATWQSKKCPCAAYPLGTKGSPETFCDMPSMVVEHYSSIDPSTRFVVLLDLRVQREWNCLETKQRLFGEFDEALGRIALPVMSNMTSGVFEERDRFHESYLPSMVFLLRQYERIQLGKLLVVVTSMNWTSEVENFLGKLNPLLLAVLDENPEVLTPTSTLEGGEGRRLSDIIRRFLERRSIESLDWDEWRRLRPAAGDEGIQPVNADPHHLLGNAEDASEEADKIMAGLGRKGQELLTELGFITSKSLCQERFREHADNSAVLENNWARPSGVALLLREGTKELQALSRSVEAWEAWVRHDQQNNSISVTLDLAACVTPYFDVLWFNVPCVLRALEWLTQEADRYGFEFAIEFRAFFLDSIDGEPEDVGLLVTVNESPLAGSPCMVVGKEHERHMQFSERWPFSATTNGGLSKGMGKFLDLLARAGASWVWYSGVAPDQQRTGRFAVYDEACREGGEIFWVKENGADRCGLPWSLRDGVPTGSSPLWSESTFAVAFRCEAPESPYKKPECAGEGRGIYRIADPSPRSRALVDRLWRDCK